MHLGMKYSMLNLNEDEKDANDLLKIENLKLTPADEPARLTALAAKAVRISETDIRSLEILRRSVDARDGVWLVYTVAVDVPNEAAVLRRCRNDKVTRYEPPAPYAAPAARPAPELPPVVVGAGPAGLFCTLVLAMAGLRPILLERGRPVEQRSRDVENFWRTGVLDPASNVQFGEGGAGAFSDGKLNTGTKDPRHRFILEQLALHGNAEDILYDAKPHVGTDRLHVALKGLRAQLLELGADIRFESRLADLQTADGEITAVTVDSPEGTYTLPCRQVVLALGHSARDTFEMLHGRGVPMEAKPFAVGVRIEHRQSDMDCAQYRRWAGHPGLPASTYKLSCHLPEGRAAYSFCVCPGGTVVAAASEEQRLVTNGMSEYARDGENINGGLLVNVTPEDFGGDKHPLAGIAFQRRLEEAAFALGGNNFHAPCQRVGDFLAHRASVRCGRVTPSYRPGVTYTNLRHCLPDFICDTLEGALPILGKKLMGYADPDALLTAVETRSSSPVRLPRDETYQSALRGLYPCGEGAGYAGGILSAAADGMRCAESVCRAYPVN